MGCLRARLWRAAWVANGFVGYVTRGHGRCVFDQRFPLRSRSLPLHRTIFHPWRFCFSGLWPGSPAAWTIRVELAWPRNNRRSDRLHLYSWSVSRPISEGIQRALTNRWSQLRKDSRAGWSHREISLGCLPRHPAVAYLFFVRPLLLWRRQENSPSLIFCRSWDACDSAGRGITDQLEHFFPSSLW